MEIHNIYKLRQEKLTQIGIDSYQSYLKSEEWKSIRSKIKKRTAKKWNFCNICGSGNNLNIHHSSYKVIGQENPGNTVKMLCRECHNSLHEYSKQNPNFSFYKCFGKIKSARKKAGLPIFIPPIK